MKKTPTFLCVLIFSLTSAQVLKKTSQSKTINSREAKPKAAVNSSSNKQKKDELPLLANSAKENIQQPIRSVTDNIENVSGDQYSFKGFARSNGPAIILQSSNGSGAVPLDLAPNDFIGSIYFSPWTAGRLNTSGGSSINSYYRGDGTTLLSDLIFRTSNGERLRIDPTGNIGVGTPSPNHLLDLGTTIGTTADDIIGKKLAVYNNTSGTDFYGLGSSTDLLQFHAGSTATKAPGMVLHSSGNVGIGTTTPNNTLDLGTVLGSTHTDVLGKKLAIYNSPGGADFYGLGASYRILQFHAGSTKDKAPAMVLNYLGKLGIGTTSPNSVLDLGPYLANNASEVQGKKLAVYNNEAGTDFYGLGSSSGILQFHAGSAPTVSPGMVLSSSGNLGVGTTAPNSVLDLGPYLANNASEVQGKKLAVYNNEAGTDFYGLGSSSGILQFHAGSAPTVSPGMVLSSSGNLGVGTTIPHSTLDLGPYLANNATNASGKKLAVYNNNDGTDFYGLGSSTDLLQFHAGSTATKAPGMVLHSSGYVGIGTTTPTNTLDLGTVLGSTHTDVLGKKLAIYNSPGGTDFYGLGASYRILQFHAGSAKDKAPAMVLNYLGNLGIGTISPKKTIDIEGTARISQTVPDNIPNKLVGGTHEPMYVSTTDGAVRYAPNGYTRVSGGYRPGGNALIAKFPRTNLIARIRFVHYVDNSDDKNNGTSAAYAYGDFTIIGTDYSRVNTIVDVTVKGYDGNPKSFTRTDTSISWVNSNLGTTQIILNQDNGELSVTNTNGTVFSYFFEILGGI